MKLKVLTYDHGFVLLIMLYFFPCCVLKLERTVKCTFLMVSNHFLMS